MSALTLALTWGWACVHLSRETNVVSCLWNVSCFPCFKPLLACSISLVLLLAAFRLWYIPAVFYFLGPRRWSRAGGVSHCLEHIQFWGGGGGGLETDKGQDLNLHETSEYHYILWWKNTTWHLWLGVLKKKNEKSCTVSVGCSCSVVSLPVIDFYILWYNGLFV